MCHEPLKSASDLNIEHYEVLQGLSYGILTIITELPMGIIKFNARQKFQAKQKIL